jgi:hypothetical protein
VSKKKTCRMLKSRVNFLKLNDWKLKTFHAINIYEKLYHDETTQEKTNFVMKSHRGFMLHKKITTKRNRHVFLLVIIERLEYMSQD